MGGQIKALILLLCGVLLVAVEYIFMLYACEMEYVFDTQNKYNTVGTMHSNHGFCTKL